jgi:hypothetical protein
MLLGGAPGSYGQEDSGLLWARGNQICQEVQSGKMWQVEKKRGVATAGEAKIHVAGLQLEGYDDWRLPTKAEMLNLAKIFFRHKNNDCDMSMRGDFWIVEDKRPPSPVHWETDFACGPEYRYIEAIKSRGNVRAIRP